jgi:hypothetical protein
MAVRTANNSARMLQRFDMGVAWPVKPPESGLNQC